MVKITGYWLQTRSLQMTIYQKHADRSVTCETNHHHAYYNSYISQIWTTICSCIVRTWSLTRWTQLTYNSSERLTPINQSVVDWSTSRMTYVNIRAKLVSTKCWPMVLLTPYWTPHKITGKNRKNKVKWNKSYEATWNFQVTTIPPE